MDPLPARERIVGEWRPPGLLRPRMPRYQNALQLGSSVDEIPSRLRRRPELWVEYQSLLGEELTEGAVELLLRQLSGDSSAWAAIASAEWIGNWIDREFTSRPARQSELRHALQLARNLLSDSPSLASGYSAVVVGKAALFLGLLFLGPHAERLLDVSESLLLGVLDREFLEDGGHRSCSPMWQALVVEGLLDCLNLSGAYPRRFPPLLLERLNSQVPGLLGWLRRVTQPDGSPAYFHDTTLGVSAFPGELVRYAESLGLSPDHRRGHDGIVRLECLDSLLLIDLNSAGLHPSQHDALFSFEWSHKGYRLVGNPGISTWEEDAVRQIELSAPGHSVLVVDGKPHSAPGGLLRKPRLARRVEFLTDHQTFIECVHDGYTRLSHPVHHRRRIEVHNDSLRVYDSLEGSGQHRVQMWFPFRPKVRPSIIPDPKMQSKCYASKFAAGFRTVVAAETVECAWEGNCPVSFITTLPAR